MVSNNEIFHKAATKQVTLLRYLIATHFTKRFFFPLFPHTQFLKFRFSGKLTPRYEIGSKDMVMVELFENALYTIGMQVPKELNYKPEVLQMTQSAG